MTGTKIYYYYKVGAGLGSQAIWTCPNSSTTQILMNNITLPSLGSAWTLSTIEVDIIFGTQSSQHLYLNFMGDIQLHTTGVNGAWRWASLSGNFATAKNAGVFKGRTDAGSGQSYMTISSGSYMTNWYIKGIKFHYTLNSTVSAGSKIYASTAVAAGYSVSAGGRINTLSEFTQGRVIYASDWNNRNLGSSTTETYYAG